MVLAEISTGGPAHGGRELRQRRPTWAEVIIRWKSPEASWERAFAVRGVIWDDRAFAVRGQRRTSPVTSAVRRRLASVRDAESTR